MRTAGTRRAHASHRKTDAARAPSSVGLKAVRPTGADSRRAAGAGEGLVEGDTRSGSRWLCWEVKAVLRVGNRRDTRKLGMVPWECEGAGLPCGPGAQGGEGAKALSPAGSWGGARAAGQGQMNPGKGVGLSSQPPTCIPTPGPKCPQGVLPSDLQTQTPSRGASSSFLPLKCRLGSCAGRWGGAAICRPP